MSEASNGNFHNRRFLDAASEPSKAPSPISSYDLKPLVSLKEAIRPLDFVCDNIEAYAWTATVNCENPQDGLTSNESSAIYLYTMECLYKQMNAALRNEDRKQLIPYFSYLKLLLTALWKIEDVKDVVWRGVKEKINDDFKIGKKFFWWGLTSCTASLELFHSDTFLGDKGDRILFAIQCFNGKRIQNHSQFPRENEVLLLPCSYFEVMGYVQQGNGLRIIHLKQIVPPVILLPPPSKSLAHSRMSISNKESQNTDSLTNTENVNSAQHLTDLPDFWGRKTNKDGSFLFYDQLNGRTTPVMKCYFYFSNFTFLIFVQTDPRFYSGTEVNIRLVNESERLKKYEPLPVSIHSFLFMK